MAKILTIDLGTTFGWGIHEDGILIESGECRLARTIKTPARTKRDGTKVAVKYQYHERSIVEFLKTKEVDEIWIETGAGLASKMAWRRFGALEQLVIGYGEQNNIPVKGRHISWLKNYERRLPKTNENDAIELYESSVENKDKLKELSLSFRYSDGKEIEVYE